MHDQELADLADVHDALVEASLLLERYSRRWAGIQRKRLQDAANLSVNAQLLVEDVLHIERHGGRW